MNGRGVGGAAGLVTLLSSSSLLFGGEHNLPVVKVNENDLLLSVWESEQYDSPLDTPPDCRFWNFSVRYDASLCTHFTISRTSATMPTRARERALACAGAHGASCVLSPEIGLALPAAFLYDSDEASSIIMILGPRILPMENATQQHVRVAPPDKDGMFGTRTFIFNSTIRLEYLDGLTRSMVTTELSGDASYCVQLLRHAFEDRCWTNLD